MVMKATSKTDKNAPVVKGSVRKTRKTTLDLVKGTPEIDEAAEAGPRGRGRPRGPRSGPGFVQGFFWLRKTTKTQVAKRLRDADVPDTIPGVKPSTMGGLIDLLLQGWLKTPKMQQDKAFGKPVASKSTNEQFVASGYLISKQVKRDAMRALEDNDSAMDLSDLVQTLLAMWLQFVDKKRGR